jgi:hypothetical protein
MSRQPSVFGGANSMIGAAALESIRPTLRRRYDSVEFDSAGPVQEDWNDPAAKPSLTEAAAKPSLTEAPPTRESPPLADSVPPPRMPPRQSGTVPAAPAKPAFGVETIRLKPASAAGRLGPGRMEGGIEPGDPASDARPAPRRDDGPVRNRIDVRQIPVDVRPAAGGPASVTARRFAQQGISDFRSPDVQAEAIESHPAPAAALQRAVSKQAAVSGTPVFEAEQARHPGQEPKPHDTYLDALSSLLSSAHRQRMPQDQTARTRHTPDREPATRASPPQVHIGTLEIRIDAPAPAKAPPARAPLPSAGPGIVSRLRLRSL